MSKARGNHPHTHTHSAPSGVSLDIWALALNCDNFEIYAKFLNNMNWEWPQINHLVSWAEKCLMEVRIGIINRIRFESRMEAL